MIPVPVRLQASLDLIINTVANVIRSLYFGTYITWRDCSKAGAGLFDVLMASMTPEEHAKPSAIQAHW